ncbi:nuclear transport factor 2 family protein [Azospirillum picis]|uniref:Ketosteroid isomerase-like protein n=1 Tax=Azospirillum picis TaxID=488438 RepID=A0ABU0MSR0_9PROT|nr:nuclear transport factor 2 family protein [Azospirillum picis]MBP2300888.1 ketosteroid isomerase-like protein [Azospirillum picis]MDQ0536146.1 ketosteroid isomerase-like protein [Azospirillum picis]
MAQTDITLLRNLYDRYAMGDVAPLFEHLAPGVEWISCAHSAVPVSFSGAFHGPEGVQRYFEKLAQDWTITRHEMLSLAEDGEQVVARNTVQAVNKSTGKPVEVATEHRWVLRDGMILRFEEQCDDGAALEAACRPEGS